VSRIGARREVAVPVALVVGSALVYWLSDRFFNAGRGDLFWLADAFLHGRTWLEFQLGPYDVVKAGGHVYVPFGPFPAILFMPLVAITGPATADQLETGIDALLAAADLAMCWLLMTRLGVRSLVDRLFLCLLLGFSTQVWWVTTRGGVWHTGHLVAVFLTLWALWEVFGRGRAWLIGLLFGAAFLTRAPIILAAPAVALLLPEVRPAMGRLLRGGLRAAGPRARADRLADVRAILQPWTLLAVGLLPALAFFLWYNAVRFGSPFESGYGLAALPGWLVALRAQGLFSVAHLGMNLDLLLWKLPTQIAAFPYLKPDGLGLSILVTSPGLLLAVRAPWRDPRAWLLLAATVLALLPNLLYYGGGWLQYGYRYALDAIPFAIALAGMAAARHGVGWPWRLLILAGVVVGLGGVYWAYHL
jgi:hypothetical protein